MKARTLNDVTGLTLEQAIAMLEKSPVKNAVLSAALVDHAVNRLQELTRRLAALGLKAYTDGDHTIAQAIEDGLSGVSVIVVPEMKDLAIAEAKTRQGQGDRELAAVAQY